MTAKERTRIRHLPSAGFLDPLQIEIGSALKQIQNNQGTCWHFLITRKSIYESPLWLHQSRRARNRDKNRCQVCGYSSSSLIAHHIRYDRATLHGSCDTALITLCRRHHDETHAVGEFSAGCGSGIRQARKLMKLLNEGGLDLIQKGVNAQINGVLSRSLRAQDPELKTLLVYYNRRARAATILQD